jgi:hypothetical protein
MGSLCPACTAVPGGDQEVTSAPRTALRAGLRPLEQNMQWYFRKLPCKIQTILVIYYPT